MVPSGGLQLIQVLSDVLVAFCILIFASGKYQNKEKAIKHQRRLRLACNVWVVGGLAHVGMEGLDVPGAKDYCH